MSVDRLTANGFLVRLLAALLLVYGTFNPEGVSFYHWPIAPVVDRAPDAGHSVPIKLLVGLLLLGLWVFFLKATRRSIGWKGALLVLAVVGALVWALIDWHLLSPTSSRAIGHLILLGIALVLTLGMSWSHLSRRLSGQVDTDETS